jgi:periplasmic protein TonB
LAVCTPACVRSIKSYSISVVLHASVLTLGFLVGSRGIFPPAPERPLQRPKPLYFRPPRTAVVPASRDSGGASAGKTPARRGTPPPKSNRYFIPPDPEFEPKLPLPASIAFELPPLVAPASFGDPLSRVDTNSLGRRGHDGIGGDSGCCEGIGRGHGPPGLDVHALIAKTVPPKLIHKIEPEFSEEARKAKFQGTVILTIEVDESGRATNMRVIFSLGLGLDEKAIEAVAQWRFRPAYRDGKPVASSARVEVNFHLL